MTEKPKIERQKDYIVVRDAYDVVLAVPIASTVIVDDSVQSEPAVWLDSGTRAGRRVRGWTVDEVLDAIYGAETTRRGELQTRILDALSARRTRGASLPLLGRHTSRCARHSGSWFAAAQ